MTASLEPGDEFEIEYGNGHRLTVRALNGRAKRKIAALLGKAQKFDPETDSAETVYEVAEEAMRLAVPDCSENFIESTDESQQFDIVGKVLANQYVSDETKKK